MRRLVSALFVGLLLSLAALPANAQSSLDLPELDAASADYIAELRARPQETGSTPADLIEAIAAAEQRGDLAGAVAGYETLVVAEPQSFRAWLQLAQTWRDFAPASDKAVAAAIEAHRIAEGSGNDAERLEALLMIVGSLRDQLKGARLAFDSARQRIATIEEAAGATGVELNLEGGGEEPSGSALSQDFSGGWVEAMRDSLTAAESISRVVEQLNVVYREVLDFLPPGSGGDEVALADLATTVFGVVTLNEPTGGFDAEESEGGAPAYDVSVETTADHSRACVRFTLPLRNDAESYREFLTLSDAETGASVWPAGLETDNDSLCLLGLEPGKSYLLSIRQGFPAQADVRLRASVEGIPIEVPDRAAVVGFRGSAYILPRQGDGEVPIYTVNEDEVPLHLLRITDRNLYRHVALGHVGSRMPPDEYRQMRESFSDELWNGAVTIEHEQNRLTTSYIPLLQILDGRRDWIDGGGARPTATDLRIESPQRLIGSHIRGSYVADPVTFQTEGTEDEAGVYALVTDGVLEEGESQETSNARCRGDYCAPHYVVQWIVRTNIGLAFYETEETFYVIARSLSTGAAMPRVDIQLVAANNRVLAEEESDANGVASFPRRLTEGTKGNKLTVVLARTRDDFSFIDFGQDRLDLSKLGVYGRDRPTALDAFLYTDRGIYRPDSKVEVTALIRDARGMLPPILPPMTLRLRSGAALLAEHDISAADWELGGAQVSLDIPATARLGTAELQALVADEVVGTATLQVDYFRPDRARLYFDSEEGEKTLVAKVEDDKFTVEGTVEANYLFAGPQARSQATASYLRSEVDVRLAGAESPVDGCYAGYGFGPVDEPTPHFLQSNMEGSTDPDGRLAISTPPIALPDVESPLAASVTVTLFDNAGPIAAETDTIPLQYERDWIGVAREPQLRPADANGAFNLSFDVVALDAAGGALAGRPLTYEIYSERNVFVWAQRDSIWTYTNDVVRAPVTADWPEQEKTVRVADSAQLVDGCLMPNADISVQLPLGTYVLEVTDPETGHMASVRFQTGSSTAGVENLEPNMLAVTSAARRYEAGETAQLKITAPFDGEVLVAIADEEILRWVQATTTDREATVELPIDEAWKGKGLYALATVFRREADGTVQRGPARAIGATYFDVAGEERNFALKVSAPLAQRPDAPMTVNVCTADLRGDCLESFAEPAFVSLYVVDEGLVNLTGHPVADPHEHFFGQLELPITMMDNYGRILLNEASTDQGGDRPSRLALSNYTSDKVVSLAMGPLALEGGRRSIEVPPLDIDSTMRIVAIAWTRDGMAADKTFVPVSSPVVARLDVPRFFTPGDAPVVPLLLNNREQAGGSYRVSITVPDELQISAILDPDGEALATAAPGTFEVELPLNATVMRYAALDIPADIEAAEVELSVDVTSADGSSSAAIHKNVTVPIRPPIPPTIEMVRIPLEPDEPSVPLVSRIEPSVEGRYDEASLKLQARFSSGAAISVAALASEDVSDPSPVLEQLIWTGMVLASQPPPDQAADAVTEKLRTIVRNIQALQSSDGSFLPYRTVGGYNEQERGTGAGELNAIFRTALTLDFLNGVSGKSGDTAGSVEVPVSRLVERLAAQFLVAAGDSGGCTPAALYRTLVLIPHGEVTIDDVNRMDNYCSVENTTALSHAILMALHKEFGTVGNDEAALAAFEQRLAAGPATDVTRLAMILSFLVRGDAPPAVIQMVSDELFAAEVPQEFRLQEQAWLSRTSAQAATSGTRAELEISPMELIAENDTTVETRVLDYPTFRDSALTVRNAGEVPLSAAVVLDGIITGEAAAGDSRIELTRRYLDASGRKVDAGSDVKIGENLLVVIEGRFEPLPEEEDWYRQGEASALGLDNGAVAIVDLLPSAFEVISSNAFDPQTTNQRGLPEGLKPVGSLRSVEAGDDRLVAVVLPRAEEGEGGETEAPPDPTAILDAGERVDFRIAYFVRVNAAGDFVVPPTLAEPVAGQATTARTAVGRLSVDVATALR